jgi:putative transposase
MPKTNAAPPDQFSGPLCCKYLLAVFEDTLTKVEDGRHVCDQVLRWGLGVQSDGQWELLGVWHEAATDESLSARLFEDLRLRGVERIRFVAGLELADVERAVRAPYLCAETLPSSGQLLQQIESGLRARDREAASDVLASVYAAGTTKRARGALAEFAVGPVGVKCPGLVERCRLALEQLAPFYASAPRIRRIVRNADAAARQLTRTLNRAIDRHGYFPSLAAATSFVAETLRYAEGDFSAFAAGPAVTSVYHAAGVHARSPVSTPSL